nr:uncharacterized protein LOC113699453 [Coffea arabica]
MVDVGNICLTRSRVKKAAMEVPAGTWRESQVSVLMLGDFNEVVDSTEKREGRHFVGKYSNSLIDCIWRYELIDLGFSGPAHTWNNCREGGATVRKRLDRVLCNGMWNLDYWRASVTHLTRTHSDYHPIRVNTKKEDRQMGNSPFWVENAWYTHHDFYN